MLLQKLLLLALYGTNITLNYSEKKKEKETTNPLVPSHQDTGRGDTTHLHDLGVFLQIRLEGDQ